MTTVTYYNLTEFTERAGNGLVNLVQFTSEETNYIPGLMVLLIMFSIIFLTLKFRGFTFLQCLSSASFANLLFAWLLYALEIISGQMLVVSIVLVPVCILLLFLFESG